MRKLIDENGFYWLLTMAAFYLIGATLYACRIPERFCPGKVDLVFHSHQLFHMCVVCAVFVHYYGISEVIILTKNAFWIENYNYVNNCKFQSKMCFSSKFLIFFRWQWTNWQESARWTYPYLKRILNCKLLVIQWKNVKFQPIYKLLFQLFAGVCENMMFFECSLLIRQYHLELLFLLQ
jgi:hypothetical protein